MDVLIFKNNLEFKLKKLIHLIIIKSKYFKILCSNWLLNVYIQWNFDFFKKIEFDLVFILNKILLIIVMFYIITFLRKEKLQRCEYPYISKIY